MFRHFSNKNQCFLGHVQFVGAAGCVSALPDTAVSWKCAGVSGASSPGYWDAGCSRRLPEDGLCPENERKYIYWLRILEKKLDFCWNNILFKTSPPVEDDRAENTKLCLTCQREASSKILWDCKCAQAFCRFLLPLYMNVRTFPPRSSQNKTCRNIQMSRVRNISSLYEPCIVAGVSYSIPKSLKSVFLTFLQQRCWHRLLRLAWRAKCRIQMFA